MTRANGETKVGARDEHWRERIAEQERSGMPVQRFCEVRGLTEQSFYVAQTAAKTAADAIRITGNRVGAAAIQSRRDWSWCWRRESGCASARNARSLFMDQVFQPNSGASVGPRSS